MTDQKSRYTAIRNAVMARPNWTVAKSQPADCRFAAVYLVGQGGCTVNVPANDAPIVLTSNTLDRYETIELQRLIARADPAGSTPDRETHETPHEPRSRVEIHHERTSAAMRFDAVAPGQPFVLADPDSPLCWKLQYDVVASPPTIPGMRNALDLSDGTLCRVGDAAECYLVELQITVRRIG